MYGYIDFTVRRCPSNYTAHLKQNSCTPTCDPSVLVLAALAWFLPYFWSLPLWIILSVHTTEVRRPSVEPWAFLCWYLFTLNSGPGNCSQLPLSPGFLALLSQHTWLWLRFCHPGPGELQIRKFSPGAHCVCLWPRHHCCLLPKAQCPKLFHMFSKILVFEVREQSWSSLKGILQNESFK